MIPNSTQEMISPSMQEMIPPSTQETILLPHNVMWNRVLPFSTLVVTHECYRQLSSVGRVQSQTPWTWLLCPAHCYDMYGVKCHRCQFTWWVQLFSNPAANGSGHGPSLTTQVTMGHKPESEAGLCTDYFGGS